MCSQGNQDIPPSQLLISFNDSEDLTSAQPNLNYHNFTPTQYFSLLFYSLLFRSTYIHTYWGKKSAIDW